MRWAGWNSGSFRSARPPSLAGSRSRGFMRCTGCWAGRGSSREVQDTGQARGAEQLHTADDGKLLVQVHYFVGLRIFSKGVTGFPPNRAESAATIIPALSTSNRRGSVVIPRVFAPDDSKLPSANA